MFGLRIRRTAAVAAVNANPPGRVRMPNSFRNKPTGPLSKLRPDHMAKPNNLLKIAWHGIGYELFASRRSLR